VPDEKRRTAVRFRPKSSRPKKRKRNEPERVDGEKRKRRGGAFRLRAVKHRVNVRLLRGTGLDNKG